MNNLRNGFQSQQYICFGKISSCSYCEPSYRNDEDEVRYDIMINIFVDK